MKIMLEIPELARVMTYQIVYLDADGMRVKSEVLDTDDLDKLQEVASNENAG